jgi:hypothetical protein
VEIPELGIKNSRLADRVIDAIRNSGDIYDMAHRLVNIADTSIHNQRDRNLIDLAIERARTPGFSLSRKEKGRIKRLLMGALADVSHFRKALGTDAWPASRVSCWLKDQLCYFKGTTEKVYEKLERGEVRQHDRPFSPYLMRLDLSRVFEELGDLDVIASEKQYPRLTRAAKCMRKKLISIARIVKSPITAEVSSQTRARRLECIYYTALNLSESLKKILESDFGFQYLEDELDEILNYARELLAPEQARKIEKELKEHSIWG